MDSEYLDTMDDDATAVEVVGVDLEDIHWETFLDGDDVVTWSLFFSKAAYYAKEQGPLNMCFENYVRERAPFAPHFRGTMVLFGLEDADFMDFVAACEAKWGEKPTPTEDIPDGLLKAFNQLKEPADIPDRRLELIK